MSSLTNTDPNETYTSLLTVGITGSPPLVPGDPDTVVSNGLTSSIQTVQDGFGNNSALGLSTAGMAVTGTFTLNGHSIVFPGNVTIVGAYNLTITLTNTTSVTFPTSGTLATLAGSETLTNKTLTAPVIKGTNGFNVATFADVSSSTDYLSISSGTNNNSFIGVTSSQTNASTSIVAKGTGRVVIGSTGTTTQPLALGFNTSSGIFYGFTGTITSSRSLTLPDADVILTSGTMVSLTGAQTLTNKTITTPKIAQINDTNGNSELSFTTTTSAVNSLNIVNNSTGNAPVIQATGNDANIDIWIQAKNTGVPTLLGSNTTSALKLYSGTSQQHLTQFTAPNTSATRTIAIPDTDISCFVVQRVSTQTGAVASGTTTIAYTDTVPQNTNGDQYMTLAITPKSTANILKIEVVFNGAASITSSGQLSVALFQDSTAAALAAVASYSGVANTPENIKLIHTMAAGTVSATTFKVRAGLAAAGTTTFNGASAARIFGGVMASSITITEYSS